MERQQYLERVITGLEQQIPDMKSRLQYFEDEDLEKRYTEKFVASMEEQLADARRELAVLEKKSDSGG